MARQRFADKVVIITGASSGIGKELAYLFADEGACLSLAARNRERLDDVASEIRKRGGKALVVQTDVSDDGQCKNLIECTVDEFKRIDILINNAGYGMRAKLDEMPDLKQFEALMQANFMGGVYCTYYTLPFIKETRGRIVGVSSVVGKFATPGNTAYCSSKFAMQGFFDALRLDLMEEGVGVTTIYPGLTVTEFAERVQRPDGQSLGEAGRRIYSPKTMSAKQAARIIINAVAAGRREVVLTRDGRIAVWLHNHFPAWFDRITLSFARTMKKIDKR